MVGSLNRRWRNVVAAVATAALGLGLAAGVPSAVADTEVGAPWVSGQNVVGKTVSVTLKWDAVRGVPAYDVAWATSMDYPFSVGGHAEELGFQGTELVIPRLAPGTTYCFAVRPAGGGGGTRSCKVTTPLSRAVKPTKLAMKVGTFNVRCGSKSKCNGGWKWKKRQKKVLSSVNLMGTDVIGFQEGNLAHKYGKKKRRLGKAMPKRGFELACQTDRKKDLFSQTVYVRSSVYQVMGKKFSKGRRFSNFNDPDHGFCYSLIRHRATGRQIVAVSLHLHDGKSAGPARRNEINYVLKRLARFGSTPTVIVGDFNSHRGLDRLGLVDLPRVALEAKGFADSSDIAEQLTLPYLNSATGFDVKPPRSTTWPTHTDRLFVSPGITVASWAVVAVLRGALYATPMASDHNPVKATLYIP